MTKLTQAHSDLPAQAAPAERPPSEALKDRKTAKVARVKRGRGPAKKAPEIPAVAAAAAASPKGKLGIVVALLRRPNGASLEELMAATGWQKHSVRGALSGAVKKKLGLPVISEKVDGARVYRLEAEAAA